MCRQSCLHEIITTNTKESELQEPHGKEGLLIEGLAAGANHTVLIMKEEVSSILGLGVHSEQVTAVMPFTFPPALTDIDRQQQQTQLAIQLRIRHNVTRQPTDGP